jgi:hypothetical protein
VASLTRPPGRQRPGATQHPQRRFGVWLRKRLNTCEDLGSAHGSSDTKSAHGGA